MATRCEPRRVYQAGLALEDDDWHAHAVLPDVLQEGGAGRRVHARHELGHGMEREPRAMDSPPPAVVEGGR
jgi:hypothetical protein